jgi:catechol-2,3-dioxygenase
MARIKEIGHAVLYARDPKASADWYCDLLGMEIVTDAPRLSGFFLSFGHRDHDLGLFPAGSERSPGQQDMNHLAFEMEGDLDDLRAFRRQLVEKDVTITGTVDHGISYGIYFLDPDGHQLEVFWQRTRPEEDSKALFRAIGAKSIPVDLDKLEN